MARLTKYQILSILHLPAIAIPLILVCGLPIGLIVIPFMILHELLHIVGAIVHGKRYRKGIGISLGSIFVIVQESWLTVSMPFIVGAISTIAILLAMPLIIGVLPISYAPMMIAIMLGLIGMSAGSAFDLLILVFMKNKKIKEKLVNLLYKNIEKFGLFIDFESRRILSGKEAVELSKAIDRGEV